MRSVIERPSGAHIFEARHGQRPMSGGAAPGQRGNVVGPGGPGGAAAAAPSAAPAVVPFDQAAHRGLEPGPVFTAQPGAAQLTFGPVPLPAQGYLRRVILDFTAAGGAGAATARADYPFNTVALVRLQDTNGAPLCELTGYNLFLMMTYGAFAGSPDPRNLPDYNASVTNPVFTLYIPVEIAPTGLGALANQSAAAAYKLTLIVDTTTNIWSSAPATTIPTFTIRTFCDFWTLPAPADMLGRPQQRTPPFNGTAQYFTQQPNVSVSTGNNNTRVTRTGNLIRVLAFVGRTSVFVRADTPFPDPFILNWDSRDLQIATQQVLRGIMREYIEQLSARDAGVYVFQFSYGEERHAGQVEINSWLPTVSATRLEVDGSSAAGGTLDILVNDVSVAETSPAARAVETSATGYHPPVAPTVMGAQ